MMNFCVDKSMVVLSSKRCKTD